MEYVLWDYMFYINRFLIFMAEGTATTDVNAGVGGVNLFDCVVVVTAIAVATAVRPKNNNDDDAFSSVFSL